MSHSDPTYLALEYMTRREPENARTVLEAAIKESQDPGVLNLLGIIYFHEQRLLPAQDMFGKALWLDAKNPDHSYNCGRVYMAQSRYALAIPMFRQALELDPENFYYKEQLEQAEQMLDGQKSRLEELM